MKTKIIFNQDLDALSLYIMKIIPAESSTVWDYFTKAELLDQWWSPNPWKCETLELNFEPEGLWRFAMKNSEDEIHYSAAKYHEINQNRSFDWSINFTDENGNKTENSTVSNWLLGFTGVEEGMKLTVNVHFKTKEDMENSLEMGFEREFKKSLDQLEELIATREKFGSHSF